MKGLVPREGGRQGNGESVSRGGPKRPELDRVRVRTRATTRPRGAGARAAGEVRELRELQEWQEEEEQWRSKIPKR